MAFDDALMAVASFTLRATFPLEPSLSDESLRPASIGFRAKLPALVALSQSSEMRVFTRARIAAALRISVTNIKNTHRKVK